MSTSGATMAGSLPPSSSTSGREPRSTAPAITARPVGGAAGERHHVDAGVGHERRAELGSRAVDGVDHARRQRLGQRGGHGQHRTGAGGRRLHHDGVAGEQGREHLVAEHRHRPVERQRRRPPRRGARARTDVRRPPCPVSDRGRPARRPASGAKAPAMPPMVPESNWASHSTLPCSRVSSVARSERLDERRRRPAAALHTSSARSAKSSAAHAGCARRARGDGPVELRRRRGGAPRAPPRPAGPGWAPGRCPSLPAVDHGPVDRPVPRPSCRPRSPPIRCRRRPGGPRASYDRTGERRSPG